MNISKNKLNRLIELYLNDMEDYGNNEELLLAESTLKPLNKIIVESKSKIINLTEIKNNSQHPAIIEDLITYINNI
jgi:hypothetical protein